MCNKQKVRSLVVALLLVLMVVTSAMAKPYSADSGVFIEPEGIQEVLSVPSTKWNTPGLIAGKEGFATHEEMMNFISDLQSKSKNMKVKIIGYSQEGRPMPILIFSTANSDKAADVVKLNKPIVWLQGQQHGNEPAGGEAMLAMAERMAIGELGKEILDKVSVIIVPRCNPDGSYYFERRTATSIDTNRDNIKFELPETQMLHKIFNEFRPEVVIDAHEYAVARDFIDLGSKGMISYYDMLMLSSTNSNVPDKVTKLADDVLIANAEKDLATHQFSSHWYYGAYKTDVPGLQRKVVMAGGEPIIARNAYGLQPAISILVESRGIGIGKQDFARRVQGHVITHSSFLKSIAQNATVIKNTISQARADIAQKGEIIGDEDTVVITAQPLKLPNQEFKLINLENVAVDTINVEAYTYKNAQPVLERTRPYAYIMPAAYHDIAKKLANSGVEVRKTKAPMKLNVESYKITSQKVQTTYYEGHYRNFVQTEVSTKDVELPAGSYVYYMNQPTGNLIAMGMEPESQSSFVAYNYLPFAKGEEIPVYRLMQKLNIATQPVEFK